MPRTSLQGIPGSVATDAGSTGSTTMTAISASATPGTLGTGVQLTASIPQDTIGLLIKYRNTNGGSPNAMVTLAINSGMTQVLVPDFYLGSQATWVVTTFFIPIKAPAGAPLYAALRSDTASDSGVVAVELIAAAPGGPVGFSRATTYGLTIANPPAGTIIPGHTTTANSYGTPQQIVASTTNPIRALFAFFIRMPTAPTANADLYVDILVGTSQVIAKLQLRYSAANPTMGVIGPIPVSPIPAGSQLQAKCQCSQSATANSRDADLYLIGLD